MEGKHPEHLIVKGVYKDTYNLYLKYYRMPESEEKWKSLLKDVDEIHKKYGKCEMASDLCVALYKQLGKESKMQN